MPDQNQDTGTPHYCIARPDGPDISAPMELKYAPKLKFRKTLAKQQLGPHPRKVMPVVMQRMRDP